jgi:hypothetical protein
VTAANDPAAPEGGGAGQAWRLHGRVLAATAALSLLAAGAVALKTPTPVGAEGRDVRVVLWILVAVGFLSHAILSSALLPPLLREVPGGLAATLAHAFATIGAAGAITLAIVLMA